MKTERNRNLRRTVGAITTAAFILGACNNGDGTKSDAKPVSESSSATTAQAGEAPAATGDTAAGTGDDFTIGWSPLSEPQTEGRKAVDDGYRTAIEAAGGEMAYCAPSAEGANAGDPALQANCVDQFIAQKVDAMVIWAVDVNAITDSIIKANEANIPVFLHFSTVAADSGAKVVLSLRNPNAIAGPQIAQDMVDFLVKRYGKPQGKVLQIQGLPTALDSIERGDGFASVYDQYPDIEVTVKPADWDVGKATTIISDWMTANPDTDAILFESGAEYSPAAKSALSSISRYVKNGEDGKVYLGGIDGVAFEFNEIACGYQNATSDEGYHVSTPAMAAAVIAYVRSGQEYVAGDSIPIDDPYGFATVTADPTVSGLVLSVSPVFVNAKNVNVAGLYGNTVEDPPNGTSPSCD